MSCSLCLKINRNITFGDLQITANVLIQDTALNRLEACPRFCRGSIRRKLPLLCHFDRSGEIPSKRTDSFGSGAVFRPL